MRSLIGGIWITMCMRVWEGGGNLSRIISTLLPALCKGERNGTEEHRDRAREGDIDRDSRENIITPIGHVPA